MKPTPGVHTFTILGREYSFYAPPNEELILKQAANLLHDKIEENKRLFPNACHQELLIVTALNCCVPILQHTQQEAVLEKKLSSFIEILAQHHVPSDIST
ncbi:MAG: cell division protein ZapA [Pseudomonas sp.]